MLIGLLFGTTLERIAYLLMNDTTKAARFSMLSGLVVSHLTCIDHTVRVPCPDKVCQNALDYTSLLFIRILLLVPWRGSFGLLPPSCSAVAA